MFKHHSNSFGKYQQFTFENEEGTGFSLVPEYGACLLDLRFSGHSVLDTYTTPEELDFNRWFKNLLLFPFPNRLKDGHYEWKDQSFQFPINDAPTGNALHGFGYNQTMKILAVELEEQVASVLLQYDYMGNIGAYPFPFKFQLELKITNDHTFRMNMRFENTGSNKLPIGWGWHPYFKLSEKVDDMSLQTPDLEMIGIDKYMIPTGKKYDYDEFAQMKKIGATVLDNSFLIKDSAPKSQLFLKGDSGTLEYWQESGEEQYRYVQLFTPPSRQSLAIEPMTCNIDVFNNREGLIILAPGETKGASFGLNFTPRSIK